MKITIGELKKVINESFDDPTWRLAYATLNAASDLAIVSRYTSFGQWNKGERAAALKAFKSACSKLRKSLNKKNAADKILLAALDEFLMNPSRSNEFSFAIDAWKDAFVTTNTNEARELPLLFSDDEVGTHEYGFIKRPVRGNKDDDDASFDEDNAYVKRLAKKGVKASVRNGNVVIEAKGQRNEKIISQLTNFGKTEIYDDEVLELFSELFPDFRQVNVGTTREPSGLKLHASVYVNGEEVEVKVPATSDLGTLADLLLKKLTRPVNEAIGNWIATRSDSPRTYGDWFAELEDLCNSERGCSVDDLPIFTIGLHGSNMIRNAYRLGRSPSETLDALVAGKHVVTPTT